MSDFSIILTGDVYLDTTDVTIDSRLKEIATQADVVVINLEGPLTDNGMALLGKSVNLKSDPSNISFLTDMSVDIAGLANNHICDWSEGGLADTIDLLEDNNIGHIGAGVNESHARKPLIKIIKGMTVGFLAFGSEEMGTYPVGEKSFGAATIKGKMLADISNLKEQVDYVIVLAHWDTTRYHYPMPETVAVGRSMIDAGATLVAGHHPHIIQGYEHYKDGAIIYSLGNFVFADTVQSKSVFHLSREERRAMMLCADFSCSGLNSLKFVHTKTIQRNNNIELCLDEQCARERYLRKLSRPLAKTKYTSFYRRYTTGRIIGRLLLWLNPSRWKKIRKGHFVGLYMAIRRIVLNRK